MILIMRLVVNNLDGEITVCCDENPNGQQESNKPPGWKFSLVLLS